LRLKIDARASQYIAWCETKDHASYTAKKRVFLYQFITNYC
jgi:hypothetical protein